MTNRTPKSSIMGGIGPERSKLFALELGKENAAFDIFFTLASTDNNE